MQTMQVTEMTENLELYTYPVRAVVKLTILQRKASLEHTQLIDRLHRTEGREDGNRSNKELLKTIQM